MKVTIEQVAYTLERFHVFYWARIEASKEGREYSFIPFGYVFGSAA